MAKITVEETGVHTFYAVDIDDRSYTAEKMYNTNTDSTEIAILRIDGNREYQITEEEKEQVLKAIENK